MSDRARWWVEKRSGRLEPLRASKLARSLCLAFEAAGVAERGRAFELAGVVLARVRAAGLWPCASAEIACAAQQALLEAGLGGVARCHARVMQSRRRGRAAALSSLVDTPFDGTALA